MNEVVTSINVSLFCVVCIFLLYQKDQEKYQWPMLATGK